MADAGHSTANGSSNVDTLKGNAQAALQSLNNGPVAQNAKDQYAKTATGFSNLAASRQPPTNPAATGQPLTNYHSFFSRLLSWEDPRTSAIVYAGAVAFIIAARYLDVIRYGFKLTWMVLAATVAAEIIGKFVLNNGIASQLRPRSYYTVPRETIDWIFGDIHELINFFVIESQRIVFAENVYASAAAGVAAFLSYFLVKIVPYWGLALMGTTVLFGAPLIYTTNQELIDNQLQQASDMVSAQTNQFKSVATKHTAHATEITKQYMGDYTSKAQQMIRGGRSASPEATHKPAKQYNDADFPAAPKEDFTSGLKSDHVTKTEQEPLIAT